MSKENPQSINWNEILSGGEKSPIRLYLVEKDPKIVQTTIAKAVFKTLTGRELIEPEQRLLAESRQSEAGEQILLQAQALDRKRRESSGFKEEMEEAVNCGEEAAANIDKYMPFSKHYDYWQNRIRIGHSLSLTRPEHENYLLLRAPVEEINKVLGFPEKLINRGIEYQTDYTGLIPEARKIYQHNAFGNSMRLLSELGYSEDEVNRAISTNLSFDLIYRFLAPEQIDEILTSRGLPGPRSNWDEFYAQREELLKVVYANSPDDIRAKLAIGTKKGISAHFYRRIQGEDGQEGSLATSFMTNDMPCRLTEQGTEFDIEQATWMSLSIELSPIITPETTHEKLASLRSSNIPIFEALGFSDMKTGHYLVGE